MKEEDIEKLVNLLTLIHRENCVLIRLFYDGSDRAERFEKMFNSIKDK